MNRIQVLAIFLFFSLLTDTSGQLTIGYNTDGNTLSLSKDVMDKFVGEIRVNTKSYNQASWSYNDRGITQFYMLYRFLHVAGAELYAGAGLGMNLLSSVSEKWLSINIPAGIRFSPFSKFPNLYIAGEYNPMIVVAEGIPLIHSVSLGFRYVLFRE